ncbi:hypothetical protein RGR602_CH01991 [Rhizobium gallicum bv. gallicum R602sp]|uniref:Uncharacterized protein n=1 Tax=Rhizobium gallicum bv. gallicum R602sp TaxID=1041138 RepID=A0A0B4X2D5_9HYPH|nr:hypothetical protein [Rhizobium gallicum]AJD41321.1 hypothetical protein RGR602_CH01991 [Rhizobium gallicum bv. gallicum R602sp]
MQAILVAMTIFGCNDSVTQCNYVATVDNWDTVAMCDAESEKRLKSFADANYPTVIAVCEAPKPAIATEQPKVAEARPAPVPPVRETGKTGIRAFALRVADQVHTHLPTGEGVKHTLEKPMHFVSDGYSWAVQRFKN